MVGATGFEPATPCAQGRCATRLRYAPTPLIISWAPESHRPNNSHATARASPRRYRSPSPPHRRVAYPTLTPSTLPRSQSPSNSAPRRLRHRGYEVGEERADRGPEDDARGHRLHLAREPAGEDADDDDLEHSRETDNHKAFHHGQGAARLPLQTGDRYVAVETLERFFSPSPGRRGYPICAFFLEPSRFELHGT